MRLLDASLAPDASPMTALASPMPSLASPTPRSPAPGRARGPARVLDAPGLADDWYATAIALDDHGDTLAAALGAGVYVYRVATTAAAALPPPSAPVTALAWAPGGACGRVLGMADARGGVCTADASGGRPPTRLARAHARRAGAAAWADAGLLATGGRDRRIILHDARSPAGVGGVAAAHGGEVTGLAWRPSHAHALASSGADGGVRVWDMRNLAAGPAAEAGDRAGAAVKALAWSPAGAALAAGGGSADGTLRILTPTLRLRASAPAGGQVSGAAWRADGGALATACGYGANAGAITLWTPTSDALSRGPTLPGGHSARALCLAGAGDAAASAGADETVRLWAPWGGGPGPPGSPHAPMASACAGVRRGLFSLASPAPRAGLR